MPKLSRQVGSTSQILQVFAQDNTVTTGAGLTGLVFGTSGLTCYYKRSNGTASVAVTLATITTLGSWETGGFKVVDATHMPGLYEFHPPNAALASGADNVVFYFTGAASLAPIILEIELTATSNQDAIHGGMSALPNTACSTNASLLTSGTSTDQLSVSAGKILLQATQTGVTIPTVTTVTNQLTAAAIATAIWQDTTSGDFTVSSSIGKSLFTGVAPGGTNGLFIAGTNAATVITTSLTTHIIGTVDTVTTVTNQLTAAAIATAVWQDTTAGDFTVSTSPGKIIFSQLAGAFTTTSSSIFSSASLVNTPTGSGGASAGDIATAVWQDTTAGDFTVSGSIGKSLFTGGVVPGAANGLFIAGTNAATIITTSLTTHIIGTVDTVTTVTNQLTAAQIATGVWQDTTSGDFTVSTSPGKVIFAQLGGTFTSTSSSIFSSTALANGPVSSGVTAAAIATAVWQDTTSGDFTVSNSIGKSLFTGIAPGGTNGLFIAGTNATTTITTGLNTTFNGNLTGNVNGYVLANLVRNNTAQGGATNYIILDSGASSTTDFYKGLLVYILSSTGAGQARTIIAYNGTTKVATVDRPYITAPTSSSVFHLIPASYPALNNNLQVVANASQAVIRTGTAQSGTSNTIVLDSGASGSANIYVGDLITIVDGTGAGQSRTILSYDFLTATVDRAWSVTPDSSSVFNIVASTVPSSFSDQGVAQAATSNTITLQSTASSVDNIYNGSLITILSGTDAGDTREILSYVGSTKVATISGTFAVTPDTTSSYAVIPTTSNNISGGSAPTATEVAFAVWDAIVTSGTHNIADSAGRILRLIAPSTNSIYSSTAPSQSGTTSTQIRLDSGASSINQTYQYTILSIIGGVGSGQSRVIIDYVGSTRLATLSIAWITHPDATSIFEITPTSVTQSIGTVSVNDISAAALAQLFTRNSEVTYTDAISGSVVKEIATNVASGGSLTTTDIFTKLLSSSDFSTSGSFGKLIKDNVNATLSSRAASTELPTNFNTITIANNGVDLNLSQAVPITNTDNTTGDCLNAARGQGFGNWVIDRDLKILRIYAPNGSTVIFEFDLDALPPSSRTKHT